MKLKLLNMNFMNKCLALILASKYNMLKSYTILIALIYSLIILGFERILFNLNPMNYRKDY